MFEELSKEEVDEQIADLLESFEVTTTPATPAEIREYLGFWAQNATPEQAAWRTLGFLDALVLV